MFPLILTSSPLLGFSLSTASLFFFDNSLSNIVMHLVSLVFSTALLSFYRADIVQNQQQEKTERQTDFSKTKYLY